MNVKNFDIIFNPTGVNLDLQLMIEPESRKDVMDSIAKFFSKTMITLDHITGHFIIGAWGSGKSALTNIFIPAILKKTFTPSQKPIACFVLPIMTINNVIIKYKPKVKGIFTNAGEELLFYFLVAESTQKNEIEQFFSQYHFKLERDPLEWYRSILSELRKKFANLVIAIDEF